MDAILAALKDNGYDVNVMGAGKDLTYTGIRVEVTRGGRSYIMDLSETIEQARERSAEMAVEA